MIRLIDFSRNSRNRNIVTNVYLLIPKGCKLFSKLRYNQRKYNVRIVHSLNELKAHGYDINVDIVYLVKKDDVNKITKKSNSILEKAKIFYDEEPCFASMSNDLK